MVNAVAALSGAQRDSASAGMQQKQEDAEQASCSEINTFLFACQRHGKSYSRRGRRFRTRKHKGQQTNLSHKNFARKL